MNLASVATTPGGGTQPAVKTWHVTSPVPRGFQTVLYLRFDAQGAGDGLEIDEAGCQFEAVFQQKQYNALNAPPLPAASLTLSKDGKAVIVNLGEPRQVVGVTLNPPRTVELHRADGSVQADKAADASGFTDVNFGVQPKDGSAITVNQVTAVTVRSSPDNPRVGIAGTDLRSPAMFWPTPDATGQLQVSAAAAFAKALQTFLSDQWGQTPRPDYIDAALVIQSDTPCDFEVKKFNVRFHRLLTSFSSGGRQVLRYAGKHVERQSVSIQLPAGAQVASATVRIDESFQPGKASVRGDDLQEAGQITQDCGIRISAGDVLSGGQRVTPSGAVSAAAIALGVMALSPGTALAVELQADQQNLPSGRKLAEARASLNEAGHAQWVIASLGDPATLPGEPFWILVNAQKGAAVWLAESGGDAACLLEKDGAVWRETGRLEGFQAVYRVLPPAAPVQNTVQNAAPLVQLSIGDGTASGSPSDGSGRVFDIADLLNESLAASRASSPQAATATIPLLFIAGAAGFITVYPPHIAYDV